MTDITEHFDDVLEIDARIYNTPSGTQLIEITGIDGKISIPTVVFQDIVDWWTQEGLKK